ncbi:MAG: H(+)/Cl(-) exchange transporter ClcA [Phycisphaerales bacterium]
METLAEREHGTAPDATISERAHGTSRRLHFLRAAVVGIVSGLLAVAFRRALAEAELGRAELLRELHRDPATAGWGWVVLPLVGAGVGCFVGWITQRFAPHASGSGIPHLKGVLLHVRRMEWRRLLPVKFIGGVLGIGVGLSLGREGPTVQMGAGAARAMASMLRTPKRDVPQLLSAGAGAGLAAAFNAPLAGLLFVVEELHRELSSRTAAGALVAAVGATVVAQALGGAAPSFMIRGLEALPLDTLPLACAIGVFGGALGVAFNQSLLASQAAALRQRAIPRWMLPGLAGVLVGLVAWWLPEAVGGGHLAAEQVLRGTTGISLGLLLLILCVKFLLTAASYASGAPGGIFAPMLLLGALLGAAFGDAAPRLLPAYAGHAQVLAVLGMAAVFVGSVRAPLTGIVLISEMTDGYALLFPICITSLAAFLTAEALRGRPIYEALLEADLHRTGSGDSRVEPRTVYIGVQTGSSLAGKKIIDAGLPRGCLVVGLERFDTTLLPTAQTELQPGDHVTILVPGHLTDAPLQIVQLCTGL